MKNSTPPITFPGALFLVLLVLKLTHFIGWSWWYVTAPLWLPSLFCLLVVLGIVLPGAAVWTFVKLVQATRRLLRRK